ncbi:MAG TPA: ATP-binding cassette domain-containing protein [Candidatus Nanopelagicales bacterium]|nr:ATP-binding cassette domain-containing protein [Candidatus Nanopelagicales bacterium]
MTGPVAVVAAVTHSPDGVVDVLHDVSLEVAPGELLVLSGRSGSGKSTLLHLVAGVSRPTHGIVTVAGLAAHDAHDWASVSFAPQQAAVSPELTVRENVGLPASLRGTAVPDGLLAALDLDELADRAATETSLGEQQRTSVARALVLSPVLCLLDEPTSHQDDDHVEVVLAALQAAARGGTALVVASHDPRVLAAADRVVSLDNGRVVQPRSTS